MPRTIFSALILVAIAISGCGGNSDERGGAQDQTDGVSAVEERYKVIDDLYDREASNDEKLAASMDFLGEYPESEHTIELVQDVIYFRGEEKGDWDGVITFAEGIRSKVKNSAMAVQFDRQLIDWYGRAGMKEKMIAITGTLEDKGIIRFGDYFNAIEGAISMKEWALARDYCARAGPKATAVTWRAEWPDVKASDERAEKAGLNRQGMILIKDSWALANQGELDAALAGFERAKSMVDVSYIGIPSYDLNNYWGKALLNHGDAKGAMDIFAPGALIAHDEEAIEGLKTAYVSAYGGTDGYDAWGKAKRAAIARTADDFDLPDSAGTRHTFNSLRGKVTLLNFWSPT